ncbi:hypothetical protein CIHG_06115 [Coccidioides immitis H538.4]|uniref:Uncharacterized protein n=1 Tax=Coccidioides immitis H538.4 TaxID=396776 RepID=A0A0J8RU60_COCIT|nr:hypothetical protein CIHG_06115 [Coccidioides immitis H538.4]
MPLNRVNGAVAVGPPFSCVEGRPPWAAPRFWETRIEVVETGPTASTTC